MWACIRACIRSRVLDQGRIHSILAGPHEGNLNVAPRPFGLMASLWGEDHRMDKGPMHVLVVESHENANDFQTDRKGQEQGQLG